MYDPVAQCSRRFVPKLKARADTAGVSLSDYLLAEIREIAEQPTLTELQQRIERRQPVTLAESAAVAVRAERDAR